LRELSMRKSRIIWPKGSTDGRWIFRLGPPFWNGGTCKFGGEVLCYTELPGELKVESKFVFLKGILISAFPKSAPRKRWRAL